MTPKNDLMSQLMKSKNNLDVLDREYTQKMLMLEVLIDIRDVLAKLEEKKTKK